jgi:hypothetical protein
MRMVQRGNVISLIGGSLLAVALSVGCGKDDDPLPAIADAAAGSGQAGTIGGEPTGDTGSAGSGALDGSASGGAGGGGGSTDGPEHFPNPVKQSEGDTTLLGEDANRDGIRDDLSAYIESLEADPRRRAALKSFARESTAMMILAAESNPTRSAAHARAQRVGLTLACVRELYGANTGEATASLAQIRYALYNNGARLRAYNHASTLVSGTILRPGRGCDPAVTGVEP